MIIAYSASDIPDGYLLCDGSEINRITYSILFNVIGIIYGEGDKSTTFNIPDLIDKFIEGGNTVAVVKQAGLPNITGTTPIVTNVYRGQRPSQATGAMQGVDSSTDGEKNSGTFMAGMINFDASFSNSIYGASNTVQPPSLVLKYLIKAY